MQVHERVFPDMVILEPTERLTVETEANLKEAVRRQLDAGRTHMVIDLARVPYVDSCGLGTMVQGFVSARRQGGTVRLMNVNPRIRQLLTITRLLTVLEPYRVDVRAVSA